MSHVSLFTTDCRNVSTLKHKHAKAVASGKVVVLVLFELQELYYSAMLIVFI